MTEDQELMAKISQLAGQINRHKNQTPQAQAPTYQGSELHAGPYVSRHTRARGGWAPYRGRPYGRGRSAAPHRHRTLVLNNVNSGNSTSSTPVPTNENAGESRSATPNGWVAKRDRHMQLINSAIYDKEAQARAKAMEQTRKAKAEKKARIEQAKVLRYAQGFGRPHLATTAASQVSATTQTHGEYQVYLNDIPFKIAKGGSKLVRVSDDPNTANITPKKVTVAGVTFVRSKNGNLHRLGAVTSKRKPTAVKKRNELYYAASGVCNKKRCRLPHVDRAGQIRKNAASKADAADEEESDESSEDEEYDAIDSDDVDSDDLDDEPEYVEGADNGEQELFQQHDFIRF
ncbi:hypothetical protein KXV51_000677 [Aspergillus fumigatus]|nr:hypothetical protein KXX65_007041 [Aspergillus fumigatus]KAH2206093.1 hypothetical protein KXV88_007264 [Aspergillus fumigatus]KAH2683038.1 hypothetical protein KXV51_000677 [Aspergillus fumigatus]KAH3476131.1 hypothetical protein KXW89_000206 [Aspergillus fumigatus]KAH3618753.1 hypothetical protein KXV38_005158 [Aspergillus fumigatus]